MKSGKGFTSRVFYGVKAFRVTTRGYKSEAMGSSARVQEHLLSRHGEHDDLFDTGTFVTDPNLVLEENVKVCTSGWHVPFLELKSLRRWLGFQGSDYRSFRVTNLSVGQSQLFRVRVTGHFDIHPDGDKVAFSRLHVDGPLNQQEVLQLGYAMRSTGRRRTREDQREELHQVLLRQPSRTYTGGGFVRQPTMDRLLLPGALDEFVK